MDVHSSIQPVIYCNYKPLLLLGLEIITLLLKDNLHFSDMWTYNLNIQLFFFCVILQRLADKQAEGFWYLAVQTGNTSQSHSLSHSCPVW